MAVDRSFLDEKLKQLETLIADVTALRGEPVGSFTAGTMTEDVAERRLEKAMQCAIDIAAHIVTREALGNPTQYRDVFMYIGRAGIIPQDLTERLEKMAGFRNILIHEYAQVDPSRVYAAVRRDIDDLIQFAKAVANAYLKQNQ